MRTKTILIGLMVLALLTGCSLPNNAPKTATPTLFIVPTASLVVPSVILPFVTIPPTVVPTATGIISAATTPIPGSVGGVTPIPAATFCADGQVTALIDSLKTALQTSNGPKLAALVSPIHGMEVRYYRDGRVVNYDPTHAKFIFESTFQVDWGNSFGSGQPTVGSFHDVVLPALLEVFNTNYTLTCNQIQVGGTTYQAAWPYSANYYSVYYGGTQVNGNLDWHTWVIGFEYIGGKPYLYALMQFEWEP